MISTLGLQFRALTKHTTSAKLFKPQGRRERANDLSLPSRVSSFDAEYEVYATIFFRRYTGRKPDYRQSRVARSLTARVAHNQAFVDWLADLQRDGQSSTMQWGRLSLWKRGPQMMTPCGGCVRDFWIT
jgi:hypothetical protein